MSKKMIAIMKKEFARFFGDKRLVFTTILMPGLMIYILYTLLGQGIMKQFAASEDYVYQIYTVDLPEAFSYLKTESDLEVTEITVEKESDVLEKIEAEEADLLMVFQSDFDAAVAAYDPLDTTQAAPDINMYYNSVSTESSTIYNQMYQVFDDYESSPTPTLSISETSPSPSISVNQEKVGVTKSGIKYHDLNCSYIKDKPNIIYMTIDEAIKSGYQPCGKCKPK